MSSSSVNSSAVDRHLKKIYDCLNIGSNKKAVQEVDRLPKNVRDQTVFKSLKSLALIRMSKTLQATEILSEIDLEADLDEVTLQTVTSCCKESLWLNKIVDMYEAAARRKPNDIDIMSHLFMAHVRVYDFQRQKEIALQMYKNFPVKKRLHSFWAIISLLMQSRQQPDSPASKVCLSLAEKMCEKMIDDERNQEEIDLYLAILRKQNKNEDEYKFLTGPICSRLTDHLSWYKRRQAYLCLDLKMYSRAFKHYFPTLIQEYPDQLEYYQGLFKSALLLDIDAQQQPAVSNDQQASQSQSGAGTPVKLTSALAECFDIVEKQCQLCIESQESNSKESQQKTTKVPTKNLSRTSSLNPSRRRLLRGPFIARAELYDTIITNESALPKNVYKLCKSQFNNKYSGHVPMLFEFFQLFGKKIICLHDLDYMLNKFNLTSSDKKELIKLIRDWVETIRNEPSCNDAKSLDNFYTYLNYQLLKHALHDYKTSDLLCDRLDLAKELIAIYDSHRELCKGTNNKTEFLPIDHYCLLVINCLMTNGIDINLLNQSSPQPILNDTVLITLIILAEIAIENSPSNHQLKLALLKLYSLIGASKQCSDVLISLDINHFQIDTLGHLLNPVLYNTGNYSLSRESLSTCFGFYVHGLRECLECLTTSYREGRYSKIEEISNVLRRLYDSLNMAQCFLIKGSIDNAMASTLEELTWSCKSFDPLRALIRLFGQKEGSCMIRDSRDFKVLRSFHFETNSLIQERQEQTLEDERIWLRVRYHLLRGAFTQFELFVIQPKSSSGSSNKKSSKRASTLADLQMGLNELNELMSKISEIMAKPQDQRYSYLEPESSPFRWANVRIQSLVDLVKPLVFCSNPSSLNANDLEKISSNLDDVINSVEQQLAAINSLLTIKRAISSLTITVEFLSICVTSLLALNHVDTSSSFSNGTNNHGTQHVASSSSVSASTSSSNASLIAKSTATSSNNQSAISKSTKPVLNQIINKTEAQLTKLSNLIKTVDPKSLILDRVTNLESRLLPDPSQAPITKNDGDIIIPLIAPEVQSATLATVKDKLMDSYGESLREIENTCRRKIKLLRSKV